MVGTPLIERPGGGATPARRLAARLLALVAALAAIAVVSGCTAPRPPGDQPLRYRDQVFNQVGVTSNLQYGSAPDLQGNPVTLRLDVYQPVGDTVSQRPAVIWVHGGGFCCGSKDGTFATDMAELGYVGVSINYRLLASTGCGGQGATPECVVAALAAQHDAQAAVRWLRANAATYRIDPNRIAIAGSSAGGVTATLVGLNSEDPGDSGNPGYSSKVGGFVSVSGGVPGGTGIANSGDSPGQFFHGTADTTVPFQFAVDTFVAMLQSGVVAYIEPFEGEGHGIIGPHRAEITTGSSYSLYNFLDLAHAQQ